MLACCWSVMIRMILGFSAADAPEIDGVVHVRDGQELAAGDLFALERDAQIAAWINLYNAVTLKLVLDRYPIATIRHLAGPDHLRLVQ